ncbi:MAG: [FeFe] hydrogenase H-cluster maturation GTPase HydF [Azoarcus sp.]|jgi:[FeFe] hydrogenase H-cluster maturation GTPase HydF|nr:[FeFe] hydrogenase H-cluster maturation GTPase HydF [Azoarcus sp.]
MARAFRGNRLQIAILGRCNTGKSTLLNCLTGQKAAIVSPLPGTTGDPVALPFELLPLGPVTFYDTAGLDEASDLGILRRETGRKVLARSDMALVVTDDRGIGPWEEDLITALGKLEIPFLVLGNKADIHGEAAKQAMLWCEGRNLPFIALSADRVEDPAFLRDAVVALAPEKEAKKPLVADILPPGATVVCVTPIDASAPVGRLIVPQVQVLRELVETNHPALVTQPSGLARTMALLTEEPALVITDSQAVREVVGILPGHVPLTTFSILFARQKGDFDLLLEGASAIERLSSNAPVLISEACSHHAQKDDIAQQKIPELLQRRLGHTLDFSFSTGGDFPDDLERFALVIHCGGCMLNAGEMRRRLKLCAAAQVPVTNFGMAISVVQGLLDRVAAPWRKQPLSRKRERGVNSEFRL